MEFRVSLQIENLHKDTLRAWCLQICCESGEQKWRVEVTSSARHTIETSDGGVCVCCIIFSIVWSAESSLLLFEMSVNRHFFVCVCVQTLSRAECVGTFTLFVLFPADFLFSFPWTHDATYRTLTGATVCCHHFGWHWTWLMFVALIAIDRWCDGAKWETVTFNFSKLTQHRRCGNAWAFA